MCVCVLYQRKSGIYENSYVTNMCIVQVIFPSHLSDVIYSICVENDH